MATKVSRELEERAQALERDGADPLRIEVVRRARRFKRSWIEMAEALCEVRDRAAFEAWGYPDLYRYAEEELLLTRRTVDKLVGSFVTLKRHAPRVVSADANAAPAFDAVDYFARAIDTRAGAAHAPEVVAELRHAVFDEGRDVESLRRQFNPILFHKSERELEVEGLERVAATARRLAGLVPNLSGLSRERVALVMGALEALQADVERLTRQARTAGERSPSRGRRAAEALA